MTPGINASTITRMNTRLIWDEKKRRENLAKHGLDFADAGKVLDSRFRMDTPVRRGGEDRVERCPMLSGSLRY